MNEEQQVQEVVSEQNEVKVDTQPQGTKEAEKQFSKDDVNNIVAKRVDKLNKQWQEKFDALQESIKLQSMSEDEKQQFEYDKRIKELEARENDLKSREEAYNKAQYKATIEKQLSERNLPLTLSDMMLNMNAEDALNKMNQLQADMNTQVNASIENRIKASANTPVTPTTEQQALLTMEQIKAMSTQDIIKNKELVDKSLDAIYGQK